MANGNCGGNVEHSTLDATVSAIGGRVLYDRVIHAPLLGCWSAMGVQPQ